MGSKRRTSGTAAEAQVESSSDKGRHIKGHGGESSDSIHLVLRPDLAKELHQLLTAALGGARRKKTGMTAEAKTGKHRKGG